MQRQRYANWELVAVTDGPRQDIADYLRGRQDGKVVLMQTKEPLGHWGHPCRQRGIDAARGEIIGVQNDDNYLVPGFLEQMVGAIQDGADLVLCNTVHNHIGWGYQ